MPELLNGGKTAGDAMTNLIKMEEAGLFLLSVVLFAETGFQWWWFPVLILVPDVSMIGYVLNNKIGAVFYNLFHHRGLGIAAYLIGLYIDSSVLQLGGIILFGHSSMDRMFGYGLKYPDSFQHTHLGWIGGQKRNKNKM